MSTGEQQYLDLLAEVMEAPARGDRTGTGTRSVFGRQMRFENISEQFPLITTKKVGLRLVFEELRWMLMGDTNVKYLNEKGVTIWNEWPMKNWWLKNHPDNTAADFKALQDNYPDEFHHMGIHFGDSIRNVEGFAEQWGDCGPVYGYQWRKWPGFSKNYDPLEPAAPGITAKWHVIDDGEYGVTIGKDTQTDQIAQVLNDLKKNPESRRMIVSAWNVNDIPAMIPTGLPPCHLLMQFYTRELTLEQRLNVVARMDPSVFDGVSPNTEDGMDQCGIPKRYLDCQVYIRSNDLFLGAPFNIAQYSMLTMLMAKCSNMIAGDLVYTIGDAHIYSNHMDQVKEQLSRTPYPAPRVEIDRLDTDIPVNDPADYLWEDIDVIGYQSHPAIKAPIAV